nr:MAG TPA: hypothetical protein [Caudoviricetes sp.]
MSYNTLLEAFKQHSLLVISPRLCILPCFSENTSKIQTTTLLPVMRSRVVVLSVIR